MLKQIKSSVTLRRVGALASLITLAVVSMGGSLSAQSVTQGYSSDTAIQRGTVVSLDAEDTKKVVSATKQNQDRLHGVVIAANDSAITLSDEEEKTFVATIGRFDAFVSTEGGTIQPGDFLAVSNITGIVTKASDLDPYTVGKAVEGFNGDEGVISTESISNSLGESREVAIGRVIIDVSVGSNPLLRPADTSLPEFLKEATEAIAGKQVSPVRVYVGIVIILSASAISGALLYSGIRNSVISIGRNPLSKKSITKSLIQIILTSIIIFLIGLFGVYLLLRL